MGHPVKGHRVMGYNNRSGRFEATWLYTYSTATLFLKGETEDLGRTINLAGAFEASPGQTLPIKARISHIDEDHFKVEVLSATPEGIEYAILETTYSRVRE